MRSFLKLSPVVLLAGLMIISNVKSFSDFFGFSLDILIIAPIAVIYAVLIAMITEHFCLKDLIDAGVENVKEMQIVFFILMLAYALADSFMYTGVGASIINLSLKLGLSARTVAVVSFFVCAILSVATGTSWGTFAACAPIFLWMTHLLNGSVVLSIAAIAGGSCFGDNLGLISDATVVSSAIHNVEVTDRIRNQGMWSLFCLFTSSLVFFIVGYNFPSDSVEAHKAIDAIPVEVWSTLAEKKPVAIDLLKQVKHGVPFFMVIPMFIVIGCALFGISTLVCLFIGIFSCFVLGIFAGTVNNFFDFLNIIMGGFINAGSWVIIMMMWVAVFGGIMAKMNAFQPLQKLAIKLSRNVRQLMFWNGVISILGNAALADEMAQIVTIGPIIKDISEKNLTGDEDCKYRIRLRNATFSSALGIFGSQLIPWHVYLSYFVGIATTVYPLHNFTQFELIRYNFMSHISVITLLLFTLFPFDALIPAFGLVTEPKLKLTNK